MAGWRKEFDAQTFFDKQPLELQPLVTDCIVNTETFTEAKELFIKKLEERKGTES